MKYIQIFFILILFLSSCKYEEKDIFDLTPAERLNKAMTDSYTNLTSAANGWEMAYFTNPDNAGYTLLVKFRKDGMAVVASQSELTLNNAYEEDSCLFEIIADYGPVLTFNTFNTVLHRFSNPVNPDGYGYQGDYEFIVLKNTEQQIILQGKKYKSVIILTKLTENTNWSTYLQDITNMDKLLFSANAPKLNLTVKNTNYSFAEGYKHVFLMKKEGTTTTTRVPFIVTKQGIRLQDKIEIEGVSFQNFVLSTDNATLTSVENTQYALSGTDDLAPFAINNISIWNINPDKMSPDLKTAYNAVLEGFKSTYIADDLKLSISYFINRFILTVSYSQATTKTEGKIDMNINATAKDVISIAKKTSSDAYGVQFLNDVAALNSFITQLSTSYTLTTATKLNPQEIKFSKKTDSNQWFVVSVE
jgi:hypothetical protein